MRKSDKLLIISLASLAVYFVLSITIPSFTSPFIIAYNWLLEISKVMGYFGPFIVSFLGNASFLFPIPYMMVTFFVGGFIDPNTGLFLFDPFLVGIISGLGATLGEMLGWLLGYGGGQFIEENQRTAFSDYIETHPNATPIMIWFLAITPVPDDFLIVPLGAAKYPWWKVAIPQFIGKSMFMIMAAWAGRLSLGFFEIFLGNPASITSKTIEVLAILLLILGLYVLVRIDWKKMITKGQAEDSQ
jgi:membrane protein YqaA with SNARE-associated domain